MPQYSKPSNLCEPMYEEIKEQLDRIEQYAQIAAKDVLNLKEASFILGLQPETVRKMVQRHKLACYKPNHNKLFFKKSELEVWMLQNRVSSQAEIESKAEAAAYCATH